MSFYGDDDYDYNYRRRSPRGQYESNRRSRQFLNPGGNNSGLYRNRSMGHKPQPVINNIYMDQIQDAHLRNEASYQRPSSWSPRQVPIPVPYPASPEFRGRRMLGDEFIEEMAEMALRDKMRSRSRGRTDGGLTDRPDFAEWRLEQRERELEEERRRQLWERDAELKKLKDEAKRDKAEAAADDERQRIIAEYADKQRKDAEKARAEEARIKEKIEREEREARDFEEAEEKRIKEKLEREAREAKEREKREWEDFLRRQKEKEEQEKAQKKAEKDKFEAEMRRRLAQQGYAENQIDVMVDEEKAKKWQEERSRSRRRQTTTALQVWEDTRPPVYAKVHRDYLSIDTLIYYDVPYEFDRNDPNFIIILREMDKYETEVLFEHTKRLRSGRLLLEAPSRERPLYAKYRKRDRSTSRVKKVGILQYKKVV
ncbi:hypothetical protein B0A50_03022 [Salinomyces thailandicus]|uniref:Uncharacterized protein n=1 Tax=Salinomyces thailandicus TaxID=706561 RepID=A0A4U0U3M4_9PEZI|nr:hypothetical protein B0A50_03022 [Salinomyces thailandica]